MTLLTETNTVEIERQVMRAAIRLLQWAEHHRHLATAFEHWWITCKDCGAQWSACDASGPGSFNGFSFANQKRSSADDREIPETT